MSEAERRFHEAWLGMVQPIEGLTVSLPVLVDAQVMERRPPSFQAKLLELAPPSGPGDARTIASLEQLLSELCDLGPERFDVGDALPADLSLYVPEGRQELRPTRALRKLDDGDTARAAAAPDSTPGSRAGAGYEMLVWELPLGLDLDKAENITGPWEYPPSAKFDRLLRACRVPIGLLSNGESIRLLYAPHGESSGSLTFRLDVMADVGGRPVLDAFCSLLSATRFFAVAPERRLPAILRDSRLRQAEVTNELADQVFEALDLLLRGFEGAAERDGWGDLQDALEQGDEHLYGGLLTVLLRLVFLLYAEDRGLLPVESRFYTGHLSVLGLFEELLADAGAYPDAMSRRFGAWPRLLSLFRAVYLGARHGDLDMPGRRGALFSPHAYPFLEGWHGGSAPIAPAAARSQVRVPSIDDETVYRVLEKLLLLGGQRLSYRALDVEQIGSVYEALMGYHVLRLGSPATRLQGSGVWVEAAPLLAEKPARREAWLKDFASLPKAQLKKVSEALKGAKGEDAVLAALGPLCGRDPPRRDLGRLVLQPGRERRRTSSHYTPRSLSAPIVQKTLEPLLRSMGPEPSSRRLLNLKVCDPAMGSGAFLVEACRFLGDQVVAAWTREARGDDEVAREARAWLSYAKEDVVNAARRLVAQRCLYGVDKNAYAVHLAKLSLWMVTMAKDKPFTFVDHALRHGDTLVGLSVEQVKAFSWEKGEQIDWCREQVTVGLDEAMAKRHEILRLAAEPGPAAAREKERLLEEAEHELQRAKLMADLVVGAFFSAEKDKARTSELNRRLGLVERWLKDDTEPPEELLELQAELRAKVPTFHWELELPEVFWEARPDPLDHDEVNRAAMMDAFVGNPPFAGKNNISETGGPCYLPWLKAIHAGAHGNADLSAHFFRRSFSLLGAHGTVGLIATNTIAQGDTRATGLQPLVNTGAVIYDATRSLLWPGDANVAVAVVHLALGNVGEGLSPVLDGLPVAAINSRLRPKLERPDPVKLASSSGLSFQGSIVLGMGFTLTPAEREALLAKDSRNGERIFPYLGGEEVNSSVDQSHHRYVINFGQLPLEEAERWPDLLGLLRARVKPERDRLKDNTDGRHRKRFWWLYGRYTPALFDAIRPLNRCLVNSRHSKYLLFAWQPTTSVFAESLYAYPLERDAHLAVLQSRVHEPWARLLSSSLEERLRYAASDCFETFPFPKELPADLDVLGKDLDDARRAICTDRQQGLTPTYNQLKDPRCTDDKIVALRRLHENMDRAVLAAYGWSDLEVPPYETPEGEDARARLEAFEDEVIDRLFALNAERAAEEKRLGPSAKGKKKAGAQKKTAAPKKKAANKGRAQLGLLDEA